MIFLLLFLAQNIVTNPPGSQSINQPQGTFLSVTRLQGINSVVIPNGQSAPVGNCKNGSLYLQQLNFLFRCINSKWTSELRPHSDKFLGNQTIIISQSSYLSSSLQVFRNGLLEDDYAVSGTKISFNFPLSPTDKINLRYLASQ